jgi:hypothetical protein
MLELAYSPAARVGKRQVPNISLRRPKIGLWDMPWGLHGTCLGTSVTHVGWSLCVISASGVWVRSACEASPGLSSILNTREHPQGCHLVNPYWVRMSAGIVHISGIPQQQGKPLGRRPVHSTPVMLFKAGADAASPSYAASILLSLCWSVVAGQLGISLEKHQCRVSDVTVGRWAESERTWVFPI